MLARLEKDTKPWRCCPSGSVSELGRVTAKIENIENTLLMLDTVAGELLHFIDPCSAGRTGAFRWEAPHGRDPQTVVIGSLSATGFTAHHDAPKHHLGRADFAKETSLDSQVAQEIIASRIDIKGQPCFRPEEVLPADLRAGYVNPSLWLVPEPYDTPPTVKINGSRAEFLQLCSAREF